MKTCFLILPSALVLFFSTWLRSAPTKRLALSLNNRISRSGGVFCFCSLAALGLWVQVLIYIIAQ
ncbi:hypothetical protein B0H13DRAFT_2129990 [Mycena leptocephala]|nr:hypothetical protein B0H13DRAFT_2129990 [Mycena leptocephala]